MVINVYNQKYSLKTSRHWSVSNRFESLSKKIPIVPKTDKII